MLLDKGKTQLRNFNIRITKMIVGNKVFKKDKTYVMGILNVTPDSFSDGGTHNSLDSALVHAKKMIDEGADIIDIGGESTRPGYTKISSQEEIGRILPVIKAVKEQFDIPVSVDTYKSDVAKASLDCGADMINDIWGLKYSDDMAKIIKEYNASVCIMHNRNDADYKNLLADIKSDLQKSIFIAKSEGIADEKIVLDPGIGFAKTLEDNLTVTKNLEVFSELGYPLLYGSSRKSMIGLTLDLPADQRLEGTLATTVYACIKGAMFVRVHDVKENKRVIDMTRAILNS
mgnify:CR=1 FL=1